MADRPARKQPQIHHARVVRTERLTPHMVRVVLGGESLAGFPAGEYTDHYVKLLFPQPDVTYPEPFDMAQIRAEMPRDQWPSTRTYTVREWDPATLELTIDFVVHGDEGLAGPWAMAAAPGDEVRFLGPGGAYAPSAEADWHLLAGDESALPAIAAALAHIPDGAPVRAFIEVAGPEEEQKLPPALGAEIVWLHRGASRVGERLTEAVRDLDFPTGQVHAFVHGEAGFVKDLRRHLRLDRGIAREHLSISGYWRLGADEDGWQASKKEWNEQVEAEQEQQQPAA
ncbi:MULTISPECIES: siderophore-interacting protein [unclassified Streptomyces]|uniref:siderophore-interacting protein n=1 Tax=unclassified Streptomyces TaxID=2593676 RepID=UPI002DD7FB60|nr:MULTISPECIES: siderophore-interacting protein [unclassified Streptomyces]WSB80604.1 siderophore-interacting protein [Streptomyces sp. NBC_01775]WSS11186.1 siderophore-interacting protein [Streptomyces sp. NBC_01186]WSS39896.1 siderophore-interacting protein [Streptomyces sp. NBC_01187]